jgi:light-independent protochlorophyllide reductase subunit B
VVAPLGASPADLARLGDADFNVVLYPEVALPPRWLQRSSASHTKTVPIGIGATRDFIRRSGCAGRRRPAAGAGRRVATRARPWYARRSIPPTSPASACSSSATPPMWWPRRASQPGDGLQVVGLGTYSREFAREVREAAKRYGVEALITDDYLDVEARIAELQPELVLGTQMERHIAKRLGIPCAVISAPMHVQDFPRAMRRRWVSKAPTCSSTPGCTR